MAAARRIGALKAAGGLEIRDIEIERRIINSMEEKAAQNGLPKGIIGNLFESLIEASVKEQKEINSALAKRKKIGNCVIYGGAGGMGKLLSELLDNHGYEVIVVRSSGAILRYPDMLETEGNFAVADFSIVSVPMSLTGEIIERAASEIPRKTIYEICSMKGHLKNAFSRAREMGSEVISVHPMFGPGIRSFRDKPVIFCGEENRFSEDPIWKAFEEKGARLLTIPIDGHDRLMSYILQLTHVINLMFITMLSNSGLTHEELARAASPICERQLKNARAVTEQDPKLYYEIQKYSRRIDDLREELNETEKRLEDALKDDSGRKFEMLMKNGKKYFEGG